MKKKFNDTGLCVPEKHYMVDISGKTRAILRLVEDGSYFVINRPRQYGKTTTLSVLTKALFATKEYLPIKSALRGLARKVMPVRNALSLAFFYF